MNAKARILGVANSLLDYLWLKRVSPPDDFPFVLGGKMQRGAVMVVVHAKPMWDAETLPRKLSCLFKGEWSPSDEALQESARRGLRYEIFGEEPDFGPLLGWLALAHHEKEWHLVSLTEGDSKRASALETFSIGTRQQLARVVSNPPLNLQLAVRYPFIGLLLPAMQPKIPVRAIRWYLEIDVAFTFNEIRKSKHALADDIVAYLYELLFLGQKIAVGLLNLVEAAGTTVASKREAEFIHAECNAIMAADGLFAYLKAFIEKTTVLVGLAHGIAGLESKKEHKGRIKALLAGISERTKSLQYFEFMMSLISSESLESLNTYRTGLLHKKGIADLQPHNYVGLKPSELPFGKLFSVLTEQHAANTAVFLYALALLCDELMSREPIEVRASCEADLRKTVTAIMKDAPASFAFMNEWLKSSGDGKVEPH